MNNKIFYIGTHPDSYRSGEPALVKGLLMSIDDRVCFELEYADGSTDFCPVSDMDNYKIVSGNKIINKYILSE